jgi:hypothetical protein
MKGIPVKKGVSEFDVPCAYLIAEAIMLAILA